MPTANAKPILVLAENRIAAASWVEEQGLRPSQWRFIHSRAQLLGMAVGSCVVHRTGFYWEHQEHQRIEEEIHIRKFANYEEKK